MTGNVTPLENRKPAKDNQPALDIVRAFDNVSMVNTGTWRRTNPDQLVGKFGLPIYAKMRIDEQIKAVMNFKRDAIVSRGWVFKYEEGSKLAAAERAKRIDLCNRIVDRMPGSFTDAINAIATGRDYGFSLTEKIYSEVKIDGAAYIGVSALKLRDPVNFEFVTDEYGTLTEFRQRVAGRVLVLDITDFIHYVHAPEFDPYYGRSDLREAYRAWFSKEKLIANWLEFADRFAGGVAVMTATSDAAPRPGSREFGIMQDIVQSLRGSGGVLVPYGMTFDVTQPPTTDMFEKAITFFDLAIAKSLLVPNLLGVSHTGKTGAYSQSQTQLETFYWTLAADAQRIETALNEQLFKPLWQQNFADDEGPSFAFNPMSEEKARWMVETFNALVSGNAIIPTEDDERIVRDIMGLEQREADSVPLVTPAQQAQIENQQANTQATLHPPKTDPASPSVSLTRDDVSELVNAAFARHAQQPAPVTVNVVPSPAGAVRPAPVDVDPSTREAAKGPQIHVHGLPPGVNMAAVTAAAQRVPFSMIDQRQRTLEAQLITDCAGFVAKVVKRLISSDHALEPANVASVEFSADEKGRLKGILRKGLSNSYIGGVNGARSELDNAGLGQKQRMARVKMASVRDVAAEWIDGNAFRFAGNVSDAARSIIQQELLNGVKSQASAGQMREAIWNRLVSRGLTTQEAVRGVETDAAVMDALDELWLDNPDQATTYLNTVVRTNLFDALNEGRFAEFTDPGLQGFVEAFMFSAVLDERTTDICTEMDGRIYNADNPLWDTWRPPLHFNCRSILSPITSLDIKRGEWDGEESEPPRDDGPQPQAGFD